MNDSVKVAEGHIQPQYTKKLIKSLQEESAHWNCNEKVCGIDTSSKVGELLSELVNIIGAILTSKPTYVWQVYGGLHRVFESVCKIFSHGCRHTDVWGNVDLWPFVVGLRVLSPALGPSISISSAQHPAHDWIHESLQKLQLSKRITALISDRDHVDKHYHCWAFMQLHDYIGAVIICLQALEENSSAILANINPRLIIGAYKPPPGTVTLNSTLEGFVFLHPRPLAISAAKSKLLSEQKKSNFTLSLPTSPVTEKEWPLIGNKADKILAFKGRTHRKKWIYSKIPNSCTMEVPDSHLWDKKNFEFKEDQQNAADSSHGRSKETYKEDSDFMMDEDSQDVTKMPRESPDGSSDCSNYPGTSCLVGHMSLAVKVEASLEDHCKPCSPISRLVQGKNIIQSHTGTRPKECPSILKTDNQPFTRKESFDASDSGSGIGDSISPSLLQVSYGGEFSSEGDHTNTKSQRVRSQGSRTPQLRHKASSGRLTSMAMDSDQDSEDSADGSYTQTSRRRRRPLSSQQHGGMSVKSLIDSRGVLQGSSDSTITKGKSNKQNVSQESRHCDNDSKPPDCSLPKSDVKDETVNSLVESSQSTQRRLISVSSSQGNVTSLHEKSEPMAAVSVCEVDGIAFSAPESNMKINLASSGGSVMKKKTHSRSRSDGSQDIISKARISQSNTAPQLDSSFKSPQGDMMRGEQSRKRFMEDGGHSITPAADNGFFPRPQPGQSLIGFLSSKEFQKQHAELDKENAHFSISEAMIAALTQMQFDIWHQKFSSSPGTAEDSDEEIRSLQAKIREKRRQKLSGSILSAAMPAENALRLHPQAQPWFPQASTKIESTTDYSVYESPQSSSYESESDPASEVEEEGEKEVSVSCEDSSLVLSGGTSVGEQGSYKSDLTSAENVAINLLKHFNEQRLPKASDLEWLVSEKDVPQKLLPLPTSVAVGPDDKNSKEMQSETQLRGTTDWAPPRPQVILTLLATTKRSVVLGMQGWRCAGCGMQVTQSLSRHFRLCNYLGRYFCTTCHSNHTAIIPARILHKWDFKPYLVANFSFELIQRMKGDPLFNVSAVNPGLYKRCRHLHQIYIYRLQLYHTIPYINTCTRADNEKMLMSKKPQHWAQDPHMYSLDDLQAVKSGVLVLEMKHITTVCIKHIAKCQVCTGRGFICEVCGEGDAIFPFQLDATAVCSKCSACYHVACFSPLRCPRCIRRETRRLSQDVCDRHE